MTEPITQGELEEAKEYLAARDSTDLTDTEVYLVKALALIDVLMPTVQNSACRNGPYDQPCCRARKAMERFDAKTK